MVVCGGGGGGYLYLPMGIMVGGNNYLTTELKRGRDNGAIRFFYVCVCVTGIFNRGRLVLNLSIQVSKLKFILE